MIVPFPRRIAPKRKYIPGPAGLDILYYALQHISCLVDQREVVHAGKAVVFVEHVYYVKGCLAGCPTRRRR